MSNNRKGTVEGHFSGYWVFRSPIIRFGLALPVNLSRILQNQLSLKLPVIGSSTVQYSTVLWLLELQIRNGRKV